MLLAEKYAMADFNAVKSHERSEGYSDGHSEGYSKAHQNDLESLTKFLMLKTPGLSREDAFVQAKEMLNL